MKKFSSIIIVHHLETISYINLIAEDYTVKLKIEIFCKKLDQSLAIL